MVKLIFVTLQLSSRPLNGRRKSFRGQTLVRQLGLAVQEQLGLAVQEQLGLAIQEPVPSAGVFTDLRRQISDIDEEFISAVIVSSKELLVEQSEKPTKYFFN